MKYKSAINLLLIALCCFYALKYIIAKNEALLFYGLITFSLLVFVTMIIYIILFFDFRLKLRYVSLNEVSDDTKNKIIKEQIQENKENESNNNTMSIVLTTKRIIFLDKGMFVSRRQFDIPLDVINSVQSYTGLMFGELTIVHGAHSEVISNIDKKTVVLFQEMATKEVEKYKKNVKQRENEI